MLNETPTDTVSPSSFFTRARICSAISLPEPKSFSLPYTSSQHSSRLKASTRSV